MVLDGVDDGPSERLPSFGRRLDGIGEVGVVAEKNPKIDERNRAEPCHPRDDVVRHTELGIGVLPRFERRVGIQWVFTSLGVSPI